MKEVISIQRKTLRKATIKKGQLVLQDRITREKKSIEFSFKHCHN